MTRVDPHAMIGRSIDEITGAGKLVGMLTATGTPAARAPSVTEMVAVPLATAVTRPVGFTVATAELLETKVTPVVVTAVVPSL